MKCLTIRYLTIDINYPVGLYVNEATVYIDKVFMILDKNKIKFNSRENTINVWCRGSSGAILAALFVQRIPEARAKIIHIKKKGEDSHDYLQDHRSQPEDIDIVIDDFMSSGETLTHIWNDSKIKKVDFLILSTFKIKYFVDAFKHPEFPKMIPKYIISGDMTGRIEDEGIDPEILVPTNKRYKSTETGEYSSFDTYDDYFTYCEEYCENAMSKEDFDNIRSTKF